MENLLKDSLNGLVQTGRYTADGIKDYFLKKSIDVVVRDSFMMFNFNGNAANSPLEKECCGAILSCRKVQGNDATIEPGSFDYLCRPIFEKNNKFTINVWPRRFEWVVSTGRAFNADEVPAKTFFDSEFLEKQKELCEPLPIVIPGMPAGEKSCGDVFRGACDRLCGVCFPMTGWKRLCVKLDKASAMTGRKCTFMFSLPADGGIKHVGTVDNETGEEVAFDFNSYFEFEGGAMLY